MFSKLPKKATISFRRPRLTLLVLFYYFISVVISYFNWWTFVALEKSMFGETMPIAYGFFTVFGSLAYAFGAAAFIFWPYRYGMYMLPHTRRNKIFFGLIILYFSRELPLFMMEFYVIWWFGWLNVVQSVNFILLLLSFMFSTLVVWFAYMWYMAKWLERQYGKKMGVNKD